MVDKQIHFTRQTQDLICDKSTDSSFRDTIGFFIGRRLKVYDESGTLFSSTEDSTQILSDVLCWQPSGGLIAAIGEFHPLNLLCLDIELM